MNYQEFLVFKKDIKAQRPGILDLSNNNLYDYFSQYSIPSKIDEGHKNGKVHRCHMIEDYLHSFQLPKELKDHVGASHGVRHSLSLLFKELTNWIIPSDVYPFYKEEITKHQSSFLEYQTLGKENVFESIKNGTLLVTYPLKPKGTNYSKKDLSFLYSFLNRNPNNLVVIDMVYWLNFTFPDEVLDLYKTNQVIVLHSFSKIFLIPNCFGVSILPNNELGLELKEQYKSLEKDELKISKAFNALKSHKNIPEEIKKKILENEEVLQNLGFVFFNNKINPGYLFYSTKPFSDYLKKNILTIPESVFGGTGNGSIISILI